MIKYFLDERMNAENASSQLKFFRMFALIDGKYYWAIEWSLDKETEQTIVGDLNAGFMSDVVREACKNLEEVPAEVLRQKFSTFADYVIRCVGGFRSYISWTYPDSTVSKINWSVARTEP
jgi:hypothetical protein